MIEIPFNNLQRLHDRLRDEIHEAVTRVLESGYYILGKEVASFEEEFATYHGDEFYAVGVANGTDAIELALRAAGVGHGDEVITVAHTAVPTVCAIERAGATPVLVDIDLDTYTMSPQALEASITPRTAAIVPVHLYGHPADIHRIQNIAQRHRLLLIEDCAQSHGARYNGGKVGTFGDLAAFSFYPTKNMGAYGDAGIVLTRNKAYADQLRQLRIYGQSATYVNAQRGVNSRLDEIQAAILRVKLAHLDDHNRFRQTIASFYRDNLIHSDIMLPSSEGDIEHVFHLHVIRHPKRDDLMRYLRSHGIGASIHYPIPIHRQTAYADLGYRAGSLPITEKVVTEIMSLPLFIGMEDQEVTQVCRHIMNYCEAG